MRTRQPSLAVVGLAALLPLAGIAAQLPNILWIVAEDINPHLGCYGDTNAFTPNLDRLAAKGLRYTKCWSTAPVCAPARTSLITGVYPTSTGAEHMRSEVRLPGYMRLYPQFLADQGYYCVNNNKEDYNVVKPGKVWAESSARGHYKNRKPGQPFFAAFNIEVTHESQIRRRPHTLVHDPAKMRLPAYHPDTPEARHDWAQYYDNITTMDEIAGQRLQELADLGLADDTIVFFYGDNGSGMPRSKRWPYNSGLHVPLIVFVPEKFRALAPAGYRAGGTSDRLVGFIDFAPTLLSLAGVEPAKWMQGHAFMGKYATPDPEYQFGFRGRMDERYDLVRSVRNQRYIYIRNYQPHLIYGQYLDYMFQTPTTRVWKQLFDEGKLNPSQRAFWQPKPPEELYDLRSEPDEVTNLARSKEHQSVLVQLRDALRSHILRTCDSGFLTESEMHRRAATTTIYEMAQDPKSYPLERILKMAEKASSLSQEALPDLRSGLEDPDSAVRYWAVSGILMRGESAVRATLPELRNALRDSSPSVQITAARCLGLFGEKADLDAALSVLKQLASPGKSSAYESLEALSAVESLGAKGAPLWAFIQAMPVRDPKAPGRVNGYVARLVESIGRLAQAQANDKGEK